MNNIKKAIETGILTEEDITKELNMAYGCLDTSEVPQELGNQYREQIALFVNKIFSEIPDKTWENENIFDGFKKLNYRIMNSLRDTDNSLYIEME